MPFFRNLGNKVLHNDNLLFTFVRSIASSQAASWVDMAVRFILFAVANLYPWLATALGCVAGGIVNCIINYRFTFHAKECSKRAVTVKYIIVWTGSLLLNSIGTQLLYKVLCSWHWLETIGFKPDGYFVTATLITSLIVSWAWNFLLQRNFVYRPHKFDPYAIAIVNFLCPPKKNTTKSNSTNAAN